MTTNWTREVLAIGLTASVVVGCGTKINLLPTGHTLVWSDEFNGAGAQEQPDPATWTYDAGAGGWGNNELETYCAWGSDAGPCDPGNPNAFVSNDGYLHVVARQDARGNYTSARLKTQGLEGAQYGRIEARIKITEGRGFWPAFWMMGDNISSAGYPSCGEIDIMENTGKNASAVWGSVHGQGFTTQGLWSSYKLPNGARLGAAFHTYGMRWAPNEIQYYVDDPANVYATFTPAQLPPRAIWPFNQGRYFFILNIAVGGSAPGPPDATSVFPQEMLVDYIRVYSAAGSDGNEAR